MHEHDDTSTTSSGWLEQQHHWMRQTIDEHGVCLQLVGGDPFSHTPPFAYTIGLTEVGHPELLLFLGEPGTVGAVLNTLASEIRHGRVLATGEVVEFDGWQHRALVESVPNSSHIAFGANDFYGRAPERPVPLLQLSLDCLHGLLPGERGYCRPPWLQPRPGEFRADV